MAAGSDGLIEFTLISGKQVNLNVNHIVSIETLSKSEIASANFRKYGSAINRFANVNKIVMSFGKVYIVVGSDGSDITATQIVSDTRSTVAKGGITGGKF